MINIDKKQYSCRCTIVHGSNNSRSASNVPAVALLLYSGRPIYAHPTKRSHSTLLPEASSKHTSGSNCLDGVEECRKHRSYVPLQRQEGDNYDSHYWFRHFFFLISVSLLSNLFAYSCAFGFLFLYFW